MNRFFSILKKVIQRIYRFITIGNKKPKIMREAGFDFDWDDLKVQAIDEPISELDINELLWNFDIPFWEEEIINDWNLTPREVVKHPKYHQNHYQKVLQSDLQYPICIARNKKGRWFVLDGTHRLTKAYLNKQKTVKVKIIPKERISEIKKNSE